MKAGKSVDELADEYFRTMPKPPGDRKYNCFDVNEARRIGYVEGRVARDSELAAKDARINELDERNIELGRICLDDVSKIASLEASLKIAVEALEFYSAKTISHYEPTVIDLDFHDLNDKKELVWTGGKRARSALAKLADLNREENGK